MHAGLEAGGLAGDHDAQPGRAERASAASTGSLTAQCRVRREPGHLGPYSLFHLRHPRMLTAARGPQAPRPLDQRRPLLGARLQCAGGSLMADAGTYADQPVREACVKLAMRIVLAHSHANTLGGGERAVLELARGLM